MKTLKEYAEEYKDVWMYCRGEELQIQFLKQMEDEGFLALNGQKPTELFHHTLYGFFDDMTMGYLSGMIWCYSAKNPEDDHIRIDYEKYLNDDPDVFYVLTDVDRKYELVEI